MKKYYGNCLVCSKETINFPSRVRKFCSHHCSSKFRSELRIIKCVDCNKVLLQTSSNQDRCGSPTDKVSCSYKNKRKISRDTSLVRLYGITRADHNRMLVEQNYECLICNKKTRLVVDHCHKTNKVRGLICHHCNTALGMFRDDAELLETAKNYLLNFAWK